MRYFFTLLLSLVSFTLVAHAQQHSIEIDQQSFAPVQTDMISGVAIDKIDKDHSNRECARIKMRISRMTASEIGQIAVRPRGGNVEVMKCVVASEGNGLIIELTAKEPTTFYITHPKYGDSNEVSLNLEGDKEYKINAELSYMHSIVVASNFVGVEVYVDDVYKGMTDNNYMLSINDVTPGSHKIRLQQGSLVSEQTVNVSSADISFRINLDHAAARPQYVIFEVEPKWAYVVVDGNSHVPDQYGLVTLVLSNGVYNYSVSANDYYNDNGTLQVQGAKVEKRITLKPAFGWLSVPDSGDLSGANVFVDDTHIGTAPLKSKGLKSGEHQVRIMKTMYKVYEGSVVIKDNEVLTFAPKLEPDFADVTINAGKDCSIYVDNEYKGTGTWSGKLASGDHLFESRKENHRQTAITKAISPSISRLVFNLADPTPIMGTINVMSTPGMAEVYLDGELLGRTPLMQDVIVGSRKVVIHKGGFCNFEQTIRVEDGKMVDIVANMKELPPPYVETINGLNLKMIFVDGGTFAMGSNDGEYYEHNVTLDSYYIGETEITQAQWRAIMGSNPSSYTGNNRPVENVSWNDAQEFCKKLSALTGKKYVLPTEAQWEYAARGGNKSKGYTYSGSNNIDEVAKYGSSSGGHSNVKSKKPNELGIYDMSGNVWEWCSDWYNYSYYSSSPQTNPQGPSSGSRRVLRGGSWDSSLTRFCCVAFRNNPYPSDRYSKYGFRIVCLP
jgi:formylglycine-generating enzyme required for sulfatase activity